VCQSGSLGSRERCLFFGFCLLDDTDEDAGMVAVFVSGLEEDCTAFCRGGSGAPMLFDDVPLLDGVGKLYDAPSRLPPFKRGLFAL
jgi:hypothetical protein